MPEGPAEKAPACSENKAATKSAGHREEEEGGRKRERQRGTEVKVYVYGGKLV